MQVNIIVSPPVTRLFVSIKIDGMVRVAAADTAREGGGLPVQQKRDGEDDPRGGRKRRFGHRVPELAMTGYTCGDLFKDRKLMESAKACLFDLIEETEDLDILCAVGMPIPSGGRCITARRCSVAAFAGPAGKAAYSELLRILRAAPFFPRAGKRHAALCGRLVRLP